MQVKIHPSNISGIVHAPASKSSMQRACAAALLHDGETIIKNPGNSNDDLAALQVIQDLGVTIEKNEDGSLKIISPKNVVSSQNPSPGIGGNSLSCGESGLGIRMFAPLAALSDQPVTLNGTGSLLTRPMDFFDEIFPQLGIKIESNNGKLPIKIQGPLQPKNITIDGSLSSQFLTGLLFAFGKATVEPVTITVTNLKSKPYIDLTLKVMKDFGYVIENKNYEYFIIHPKVNDEKTITYTIEGDWSGAAFLLVAGAIAGEITVLGLDVFSTQADKAILQALMSAGAKLSIEEKQIIVAPSLSKLGKPFHFNATDCPDLFPPLVALAAYCDGTSVIEGVSRLTHKESNRAKTLQEEFGKLGITIKLQDNLMIVEGGTGINSATVHSHHDHRIAMACAIAGLQAKAKTIIEDADAINKSYPDFYGHLELLKANISL